MPGSFPSPGAKNSQYNLQDLFKELKEKEGIESIDDILRQVVKPDGMSFNGIAPVYRELLLKLAMSMSKDEIFIRSKNIMNEEKVKKRELLIMGGSRLLNNKNKKPISLGTGSEDSGNGSSTTPHSSLDPVIVMNQGPSRPKQSSRGFGNFLKKAKKGTFLKRRKSVKKVPLKVNYLPLSGKTIRPYQLISSRILEKGQHLFPGPRFTEVISILQDRYQSGEPARKDNKSVFRPARRGR